MPPLTSPSAGATGASAAAAAPRPAAWLRRPLLVRHPDDRVLAGVAAGIATRLAVDTVLVRVAFVVLAFAGGAGVVGYLLAWAAAAPAGVAPDAGTAPASDRSGVAGIGRPQPNLQRSLALGAEVGGLLLLLRAAGVWFGDAVGWPVALAGLGSAVIWARGDADDRSRWNRLTTRLPAGPVQLLFTGRVSGRRLGAGALLVFVGTVTFLASNDALVAAAGSVLVAVAVTLAGVSLVAGPALWRMARQVGDERRVRIRSEERAELAAHLHDSVLHTLALIQRSDDPAEVRLLARGQERELRAWLHGRSAAAEAERLSAAVDAMAGRVERYHHVAVEAVVVGDAALDDRLRAVVHASGEAAVNAARHSGAQEVSVYVEVEPEAVTAYVRDEGRGFDPVAVPDDRRGIAESIRGRIERQGGTVAIASEPGEGTEVTIRVGRRP